MEHEFADRIRSMLADVARLVDERADAEGRTDQEYAARDEEILADYRSQRDRLTAEFEDAVTALRGEYQKRREDIIFSYESNSYAVVQEAERFDQQAAADLEDTLERVKRTWTVARRTAMDEFEEVKDRPQKDFERFRRRCETRSHEFDEIMNHAGRVLRRRRCQLAEEPPATAETGGTDPMARSQASLTAANQLLIEMERQPAAVFLESGWPFLIFLLTSMALAVPLGLWQGWIAGPIIAVVIGIALGLLVRTLVRPHAQRQTAAVLPELLQEVANGRAAIAVALKDAQDEAHQKHEELVERREHAISEAHARWSRARVELSEQHQQRVQKAVEQFKIRRRSLKETYQSDLKILDEQFPPKIQALEQQFAADSQRLIDDRQQRLEANRLEFEQRWRQVVQDWTSGMDRFEASVDELSGLCGRLFPDWDAVDWSQWRTGDEDLPVLRFGALRFALDMLPAGRSANQRLQRQRHEFSLPAVLSYPSCPSLLYLADGDGRDVAVRSLQDVMLRLLTSLPPGKVRFTIVDPTGLGQNFSAFMHLADFDERLVANRIWTEAVHINKRLADLTEHMENVIQKYLRNEFESIQQYNRHAGEVAEPFQILVIANFPANFNEESARRLVSIAASGARCGVYTLISVDTKLKLPQNFDLADLQNGAVTLAWDAESARMRWQAEGLSQWPLELDMPPGDDRFTGIVRAIGERAKDANRVEVPFATVAAPDGQWWTSDSRAGIDVPLGRAGATNLQYLRLGKGTSQHVLIAGKTGSGKSTLLHALITNVATYYSPDEVQFYLIDFKKGVEFKAYATFGLPHARVIAIESEREFGMSVLDRLDLELKRRGDMFRQHGVQDLRAYRDANPDEHLPRLLLIIDEFQEFFVKDDKIAQEAALLLDRLVRQGRAFGIHVLLGSQTLAGAYSLARSTLGQMAVRIALQCSEADAHLILSDDNTAARLLGRPGEAIYNDANGMFEGNHPFQVVWLPDHEREHFLQRVTQRAEQQQLQLPMQIVFEGNVPADPSKNDLLRAELRTGAPAAAALAPRAWLGEAVAIKDPAVAVFRRQSGSNLLMVGQDESLALGVLANCVISLAAAVRPADGFGPRGGVEESAEAENEFANAQFVVLDGQRAESPMAGFWNRFGQQLPIPLRTAGPGETAAQIGRLAAEVQRRLEGNLDGAPPIFLLVFNLPRFRELRKSEDFSFSFEEGAAESLDKRLATILREGPHFGVHTLIWCDTYTNLSRWLDRQSLTDLSWRVLFQMSATDSANLMDSPDASRLGVHRAILFHEEQGEFEKFRPYGPPPPDWLAWVKQQLAERNLV
ncbi:MAG: AAA family ATPase [Pirellulaceae bacterium]|nr:AAA family ATPase [Pirellulaceae bacterium]